MLCSLVDGYCFRGTVATQNTIHIFTAIKTKLKLNVTCNSIKCLSNYTEARQ
jgi:hypothetical protein